MRVSLLVLAIGLLAESEWSNWCSERDEENPTVVRTEAGEAPQCQPPEVWSVTYYNININSSTVILQILNTDRLIKY